jgi:Spy/CpxP family protein refolding chaperone
MSGFRTAALSAVAVVGLAMVAGAQVPANDSAHRGMREGHARHGQMEGMRRGGMRGARGQFGRGPGMGHLMRDLNLTDAQKTRIKAIHEKYQPQLKTLNEQGRTEFKAIRDARQKGDTSAAARQRIQTQREQFRQRVTALRTQEQNEVRAILTAEQRAKWDAAAKERKDRFEKRRKEMQARRGSRGKA